MPQGRRCFVISTVSKVYKEGYRGSKRTTKQSEEAKRSETNFLPDLPAGKDQKTLKHERGLMCQEMKKTNPDKSFVDGAMSSTYALRRQEIIHKEPPVSDREKKWPALFCERQISAEFKSLVKLDLSKSFYEGIDLHLPKLLCLYRSKCCMEIVEMRAIMDSLNKNHTDSEEEMTGMTLGILTVVEDVTDPLPCSSFDVALVIEEAVVLQGLSDIPNAYMMGLLYALNINYPKNLRYTFEVIQRLLMNISAKT